MHVRRDRARTVERQRSLGVVFAAPITPVPGLQNPVSASPRCRRGFCLHYSHQGIAIARYTTGLFYQPLLALACACYSGYSRFPRVPTSRYADPAAIYWFVNVGD